MSDLNARFEAAQANSKLLAERPDNETLLRLYGLYRHEVSGPLRELAARPEPPRPASPARGERRRLILITHELGLSGAPMTGLPLPTAWVTV